MNVKFESKFEKDLRRVKDRKILANIKEIIVACQQANDLGEIQNIKKMQGYTTFYRIRLGEYRIGIEVVEEQLIFVRFLHRKEIYRFFP